MTITRTARPDRRVSLGVVVMGLVLACLGTVSIAGSAPDAAAAPVAAAR